MHAIPATPPEGKALVYIIRPSIKVIKMAMIICDGKYINMISAKQYLTIILDPGEHIIYSEIGGTGAVNGLSKLKFNTESGKIYFIEMKLHHQPCFWSGDVPWYLDTELIHIDQSDGNIYLERCELADQIPLNIIFPLTDEEIKIQKKTLKQLEKRFK